MSDAGDCPTARAAKENTMRLVRFSSSTGPRYGTLQGGEVAEMTSDPFRDAAPSFSGRKHALNDLQLLAPTQPENIIFVLIEPDGTGAGGHDTMAKGWAPCANARHIRHRAGPAHPASPGRTRLRRRAGTGSGDRQALSQYSLCRSA